MDAKEIKALSLIEQDESYSNYFFHRLKDLKWFYPLKARRFFDPKNIQFDERGARFWNVVDYLERVSEQVNQDLQYGKELLSIIGDVVRFSRDTKSINNAHIWWYCVKILNNLPASIIGTNLPVDDPTTSEEIKYGFKTWLLTWSDPATVGDLVISDVGGKLLGKFLDDDSTKGHVEAIVDFITRIKASGKRSSLTGKDDAVLMWDSYWITDAFRRHRSSIGAKCSADTILGIADKLKKALEYKQQDYAINLKNGSDIYELNVSRVAAESLKPGEIGFKGGIYQCVIKQYVPEQLEGRNLETNFWDLYDVEPQNELKPPFSIEAANRQEFVTKAEDTLPQEIRLAFKEELDEKLGLLFNGLYEDYSHVWCRSLQNGPEVGSGAEEILSGVLRDVLMSKCEANREEGGKILCEFLGDQYRFSIFRRFVLLCADKYWPDYATLFEKFLEVISDALEEGDYEVELHDLIKGHCRDFSNTLEAELRNRIENVPKSYAKNGEQGIAYWKYKWLSPLRDHPRFVNAYNEARQRMQPKDDRPYEPDRGAFEGGIVVHKSPLSKEDILRRPVFELVKYLGEFQGADFWSGTFEGKPDREGLRSELQSAVKADPRKFIDDLEAFHRVNYSYVITVLVGLKVVWNEKKDLSSNDWGQIFDFCLKYLKRDGDKEAFLKEALEAQGEDSGGGRYLYLVETIVEFVADGCENDARAFDPKHFDAVEKIFDAVLPLLKGEKHPDTQRSALTYALNTTLGKTIRSYITFSLRVARAIQKREEEWGHRKYERFLGIGIDGYIWLGGYLPNIRYLDRPYADDKIKTLADRPADDFEWRMFMEGYLGGPQIYKELYVFMRRNYIKALENAILEESMDKRLVEHVSFGYLYLDELLQESNADREPSLFWKMLKEAGNLSKSDRWLEVADLFWSHSSRSVRKGDKNIEEPASKDVQQRILAFWAWTYREQVFVKASLGDKYDSFLGRLAKLTILLDRIDETAESWLLICVPHIDREHSATFFLEYLTKFEDEESIKRIAKIYLEILKNATPTFQEEDIKLLVERLYKVGKNDSKVKEIADDICNTYGRRGYHFLKPIWEKYQGQEQH